MRMGGAAAVLSGIGRVGVRRLVAAGLLACGVFVTVSAAAGLLDGDSARFIHVRWQPDVTDEEREALESHFDLAAPRHLEGQTFGYDLVGETWWNIRSLVRHPSVADTHYIDRSAFAVAPNAPAGESGRRTGLAWRWGVERLTPYAMPLGVALLGAGVMLLAMPRERWRAAGAVTRRSAGRPIDRVRGAGAAFAMRHRAPAGLAILVVSVARGVAVWNDTAHLEGEIWFRWLERPGWAPLDTIAATLLLAAAAAIVFRVAVRATGGPWASLLAVLAALWLFPPGGSEAGCLLYAAMLWAAWRYIEAGEAAALGGLAVVTAAAAAGRPLHAAYMAAGALAAVLVRHLAEGRHAVMAAAAAYAGALAVIALLFIPLGEVTDSIGRFGAALRAASTTAAQPTAAGEAESDAGEVLWFNIRWAPGTTDEVRVAKEREHNLSEGRADSGDATGRTWEYEWDGRSTDAALRLLADPLVEDTHRIDRRTGRYVRDVAAGAIEGIGPAMAGAADRLRDAAPRWAWVLLPIAALFRLKQVVRQAETPDRRWFVTVPALVLCIPVAHLAVGGGWNWEATAPLLSALSVVAAFVLAGSRESCRPAAAGPTTASGSWRPVSAGRTPRAMTIGCGLVLFTLLVHLHVNSDLLNDHAAYLAMARQMFYGDWPIRDYRDDGSLLQILLSAAVQKAGGFNLLGEMLLSWGFLAAANVLTYWLAFRLSGSHVAALVSALLAALLIPRAYGYPKIFIYPLALLQMWRYVDEPVARRLPAIAAVIALAFLFRIDHGVVVAAVGVLAVAAVHGRALRIAAARGLRLAAWTLLFALPQLVYVAWAAGFRRYSESILTFGAYANATREAWPVPRLGEGLFSETNATVALLYVFIAVAAAALWHAVPRVVRASRGRAAPDPHSLRIVLVVAMWALMLPMLLRGQYYTRIAEVGQPIAILGAWLAVRWLHARLPPAVRWAALASVLAVIVVALGLRAPADKFLVRTSDVFRGSPFKAETLRELAQTPAIDQFARDDMTGDRWMVRYAYECTQPGDRLLVTWFGPEVYVYAERPFAGDRWTYLPFDNAPERQRAVVGALRAQSLPLVFIEPSSYVDFATAWPALAAYLAQEYKLVGDFAPGATRPMRVLAHARRAPSRYLSGNLPCFA